MHLSVFCWLLNGQNAIVDFFFNQVGPAGIESRNRDRTIKYKNVNIFYFN